MLWKEFEGDRSRKSRGGGMNQGTPWSSQKLGEIRTPSPVASMTLLHLDTGYLALGNLRTGIPGCGHVC